MSRFVMKPLPSLSQSTNSSLALPMTSAWGLDTISLELGEASELRARPGMGLPFGMLRGLGLTGTASPLPWATNTSPSWSHLDMTAQAEELGTFRHKTFPSLIAMLWKMMQNQSNVFFWVMQDTGICCSRSSRVKCGANGAVSQHAIYICHPPVGKHWAKLHNCFLNYLWWNFMKPFQHSAAHPLTIYLGVNWNKVVCASTFNHWWPGCATDTEQDSVMWDNLLCILGRRDHDSLHKTIL